MSARAAVLEALVESVAIDLGSAVCLDLTPDQVGASLLRERCNRCDGPEHIRIAPAYSLVICESDRLPAATRPLDAESAVLVFTRDSEAALDERCTALGLHSVARVRCDGGQWWLCIRPDISAEVVALEPVVSIVVAAQDDRAAVARLVTLLAAADTRFAWELIAADRASFDGTADLLRGLSGDVQVLSVGRDEPTVRVLGKAMARARGDVVVFVDVTLVPQEGWLAAIAEAAEHTDAAWFAGQILDGATGRILARGRDETGAWLDADRSGTPHVPPVQLMAVRRAALATWSSLGPYVTFDEAIWQLRGATGPCIPVPGFTARFPRARHPAAAAPGA